MMSLYTKSQFNHNLEIKKKLKMSDKINFNVSGYKYVEPRSVLGTYPNSVLCTMVSEQTSIDPQAEVCLHRDGELFHYVLDYLKFGRVVLPKTTSREVLMNELVYFGIVFSEDDIVTSGEEGYCRTKSKVEDDTATFLVSK